MGKKVYIINEKPRLMMDILIEHGFDVTMGFGKLDDELLAECWAFVAGRTQITPELLDRAPNLRIICKQGVGTERIDLAACAARGICVTNTPESNYISVAEHTMTLMLCAAKQIYPISVYLRHEYPEYNCSHRYPAVELHGKKLAIIGLGRIGLRTAKLANAFGMRVTGYARHPNRDTLPEYITLADSMAEAISDADFVSLHVAGTEENRHMFGEAEFAAMKRSAIFINTTRGMVVDEKALYEALKNKTIAGAGLDVFEDEPLKPGNPLMHLENLVATPHTAANDEESRNRAYSACAAAIIDLAEGRRPVHCLT